MSTKRDLLKKCEALDLYTNPHYTKKELRDKIERCLRRISKDPYSDWYDYEERYNLAWDVWHWDSCCRFSPVEISVDDDGDTIVLCMCCGMDRTSYGNIDIEIFQFEFLDDPIEDFENLYDFYKDRDTIPMGRDDTEDYVRSYHIASE